MFKVISRLCENKKVVAYHISVYGYSLEECCVISKAEFDRQLKKYWLVVSNPSAIPNVSVEVVGNTYKIKEDSEEYLYEFYKRKGMLLIKTHCLDNVLFDVHLDNQKSKGVLNKEDGYEYINVSFPKEWYC